MRTVGLITEYNPFHNGHLHHLRQSKRLADAEVAVAVMSGHFLQRGEPALVDKWTRTRMALAAGVDVVVELPFPWACNSAPQFADGAVAVLEALGGIDALCFGSESGELESLQGCARVLQEQDTLIATRTAEQLKTGTTYPAAREQVVREIAGDQVDAGLLATPNNILGIEYFRALERTASGIQPLTLPRIGAGFHDLEGFGEIASATGIRRMLAAGEGVGEYLPEPCGTLLADALVSGESLDSEILHRLLVAAILRDAEQLATIYQVDNGLENRLIEAALASRDFDELVDKVKSRQLTRTRIQRILTYVLLGIQRDEMQQALAVGPRYLHLLGCSERGQRYLAASRKWRSLPLIQNFSRVRSTLKRHYGPETTAYLKAIAQLKFQEHATLSYQLLLQRASAANRNADYFTDLITSS
ncbi:MAG TPA: nucleotidyltransferase [Geothermobacteraceae bacterium]|nr:nucleotidyltransferase [Geothermobacteraceae bacterium]